MASKLAAKLGLINTPLLLWYHFSPHSGRHMGHGFKCETLEDRVLLSSGDLDSTFGNAGYVDLTTLKGSWDTIAPLSDGDFVLVGEQANKHGDPNGLLVARYTSSWVLDPTFGDGGVAQFPLTTQSEINLSVRADNKIIIAGNFNGIDQTLRLNADGTLDTTFGLAGYLEGFIAQALLSDGSMIGTSVYSLQRRSPRGGLLDADFASDGSFNLLSGTDSRFFAGSPIVKVQNDDIIVAAEVKKQHHSPPQLIVRKLLPTGQADSSFAGGGFYSDPNSSDLTAMALASNGQIFVDAFNSTLYTGLIQLSSAGALVQSFADTGNVYSIALNSNGDIDLLTDGTYIGQAVEQLLPDGSMDPRFDAGRMFSLYDYDSASQIILTPQNKLLVLGDRYDDVSQSISPTISQLTTQDDGSPIQRYSHSDLLVFYGTDKADHISLTRTATSFTASMNGISKTFLRSNIKNISVMGGAGDDVIDIDGKGTSISIDGGDGNDHITIRSGDIASITGDSGDDFIDGSGVNPTTSGGIYAIGGPGNDHIIGSPHDDYLEGGSGNDTLDGGGSSGDGIYGGSGDDVLLHTNLNSQGGPGNDTLYGVGKGGAGDDTYYIRDGMFETIDDYSGNNRAQIDDSKTVHDTLNGNFTIIPWMLSAES